MQRLWSDQSGVTAQDCPSARELFFLRCRSKNLSEHSLSWYKNILGGFLRFLEGIGAPTPRETTPNIVRAYFDHLRERGLSSVTINRTYGALRCFFRYLSQERVIPSSPFSLIEKPKMERKLIRPLDIDQIRLLLAQPKTKTYAGFRCATVGRRWRRRSSRPSRKSRATAPSCSNCLKRSDKEQQKKARSGRFYNAVAVEVHWACATGQAAARMTP